MSLELTFPKTVEHDILKEELEVALGEDIVQGMGGTTASITIYFTRETTGAEDAIITNVVTAHVPTHLEYRIWDFVVDKPYGWKPPLDLKFDKMGFQRDVTFIQGRWDIITYYETAVVDPVTSAITYTNPIVKTAWDYTLNVLGWEVLAHETVEFYREDGSLGPDKHVITHTFPPLKQYRFGQTKRKNIIDNIMLPVGHMMMIHQTGVRRAALSDPNYILTAAEQVAEIQRGRDMLFQYGAEKTSFIDDGTDNFKDALAADSAHTLLDQPAYDIYAMTPIAGATIRDYVVGELTI